MHPTFLAKLKPQEVREPDGTIRYVVDENAAKKLGTYVNPPFETHPVDSEPTGTAVASAQGTAPQTRRASRAPTSTAAAESKPAPAPAQAVPMSTAAVAARCLGLWQSAKGLFGSDDRTTSRCRPRRRQAAASDARRRRRVRSTAPHRRRSRSPPAQVQSPSRPLQAAPSTDPRAPIGGERLEPDERGDADGPGGSFDRAGARSANGYLPFCFDPHLGGGRTGVARPLPRNAPRRRPSRRSKSPDSMLLRWK